MQRAGEYCAVVRGGTYPGLEGGKGKRNAILQNLQGGWQKGKIGMECEKGIGREALNILEHQELPQRRKEW